MAEEDLKFKVTADTDDLEKSLKEVRQGLDKTGDEAKETGEKLDKMSESGGKSGASLQNMALKAGAAVLAFKGMTAALDEFERRSGIINRFSGDISEASRRVNGLSSDLELMAASQKVTEAGLELTAHQFANLSVAAQEFAAATGQDASAAMDRLADALATGRTGALKQFGVELEGVTGQANIQAAAIKKLEEKYGDMESSADTMAGQLAVLRNRFSNLASEMVVGLDAALKVDDGLRENNKTLSESIETWEAFKGGAVIAFSTIAGAAKGFAKDIMELGGAIATFGVAVKKSLTGDIAGANKEFGKLNSSVLTFDKTLITAHKSAKAASDAMIDLDRNSGPLTTKITNLGNAADTASKGIKKLAKETKSLADLMDEATGGRDFLADTEKRDPMEEIDKYVAEYDEAMKKKAEADRKAQEAAEAHAEAMRRQEEESQRASMELSAGAETVAGAFTNMVNDVAKGEADLEESFQSMTAALLTSLGEQLVAMGVKDIFMGISRALSSYGFDATAASLIANGGAAVGAGVAFGAAGAAVAPSGGGAEADAAQAQAASPSTGNDAQSSGQQRAEQTVVVNVNSPMPKEYVGRTINDATRAATRRGVA